ncbi:MAG TPA: sigma 54-interacting transcriptional regulator [Kofleriaceae bacterium]|nr:sigma 54-interacting transcriptional regulator [Kofleriaceae bacterium]
MREVEQLIERVAASDATVLVTGESGTGKELVARAIHARSPRRDGPLVTVNCAALPEALLESELFGHVKGAFTDARTARPGLFAQAAGGSLFLDEIGELPLALQPKLLRALQDRVVRPVGGDREVEVDVRIIAATNRELATLVAERAFREDLYYRLDVIRVELPPLRARDNDVLLLAQHFLVRSARRAHKAIDGFSPAAARQLLAYSWPGNVRELQNCIERAVALARYATISVEDLPDRVRAPATRPDPVASDDLADLPTMEEVERRYIARVMAAVGGNKASAARILGYDRTTLYRKLDRYRGNS